MSVIWYFGLEFFNRMIPGSISGSAFLVEPFLFLLVLAAFGAF